jgi:hypothetical protein
MAAQEVSLPPVSQSVNLSDTRALNLALSSCDKLGGHFVFDYVLVVVVAVHPLQV